MMKCSGLIVCCILSFSAYCQKNFEIAIDKPVNIDGIEYGISIRNQKKQAVKDKGIYDRYELSLYAINQSSCSRILLSMGSSTVLDDIGIFSRISCLNATGYRLTSKYGSLKMGALYVPVKREFKDDKGKTRYETENIQAGYIFKSGETLNDHIIIIVPEGEKPEFKIAQLNNGRFL